MDNELNQEQAYLFEQIKQLYSDKEWWNNPIIRTKEAILNKEVVSLKILKREAILLGPIDVQLNLLSVNNQLLDTNNVILSNYIHYDLNNITRFVIDIDIYKSNYKITYSSDPLYEYGYEEEYLDNLNNIYIANSFDEAKQYYQNTLNHLNSHIKNKSLINKVSKSIHNYFHLIKDKKVNSTHNMTSDDEQNKNNNNLILF